MTQVEEEHPVGAGIDAGIDNLRHKGALPAVLEAASVAYVRTAAERHIVLEERRSTVA